MSSTTWEPADVLPHRPPMLLLSRILEWTRDSLLAEADVAPDSPFAVDGRGVPYWVGIEYMAQAVGALDGIRVREQGRQILPGYLVGTRRLDDTQGFFQPGTRLRITVREVLQSDSGLGAFLCRLADGPSELSCQLTVYRPPQAEVQQHD